MATRTASGWSSERSRFEVPRYASPVHSEYGGGSGWLGSRSILPRYLYQGRASGSPKKLSELSSSGAGGSDALPHVPGHAALGQSDEGGRDHAQDAAM